MDDDGFQMVSKKKSAKKPKRGSFAPRNETTTDIILQTDQYVIDCTTKCRRDLMDSEYFGQLKCNLHEVSVERREETSEGSSGDRCRAVALCDVRQIVCYGVGHFASCLIARYQLALLTLLRDELQISPELCEVYDPNFTDQELRILPQLQLTAISTNEEGKRRATCPTLFYLPHCGRPLYNNLLWANWSCDSLQRITILGNSFSNMRDRTPDKTLESEASYVMKVLPVTVEEPIKNTFQPRDVFNDTAWHMFPRDQLETLPDHFWCDAPEPEYAENVEILLRQMTIRKCIPK